MCRIWTCRYKASSLTLIPRIPDEVTTLVQQFGVRWGAYRLFISSNGVPSSGITAVTVNGIPVETASWIDGVYCDSDICGRSPC